MESSAIFFRSSFSIFTPGKYHAKLSELHELKVNEKTGIASQLSEEERMLQADNDWLVVIKNQLARIERG